MVKNCWGKKFFAPTQRDDPRRDEFVVPTHRDDPRRDEFVVPTHRHDPRRDEFVALPTPPMIARRKTVGAKHFLPLRNVMIRIVTNLLSPRIATIRVVTKLLPCRHRR
ncbi:MAG: hypothetical protein AB7D27_12465 [Desulfomicrobium sp.]